MPSSVSWDHVAIYTRTLAGRIRQSDDWLPDVIAGVSRSGLIPAVLIAQHLDVARVVAIGARFEDDARTKIEIYSLPYTSVVKRNILIVEDGVDTGRLLGASVASVRTLATEVRTAALFATARERAVDVRYLGAEVQTLPTMPWERT